MVVGLSYMGDIRMGLAEDSKKVDRIATSSSAGLQDIYLPMLRVMHAVPPPPGPPSMLQKLPSRSEAMSIHTPPTAVKHLALVILQALGPHKAVMRSGGAVPSMENRKPAPHRCREECRAFVVLLMYPLLEMEASPPFWGVACPSDRAVLYRESTIKIKS